jgi:predicted O-linked N-acetylglucosamine transferase (SPINDLY family)
LGEHFISRNSASILNAVGLPELIATSPQQYIDIAIDLANEPSKRKSMKTGLRKRFGESALGDSGRFTRNLEDAYRKMWHKWCVSQGR